jgi:uncharacterized protein (DUF952 family)
MAETVAYKVLTEEDLAALQRGAFAGAPVDVADGYIHLSTAAQLTETVDKHFAGQSNLTIAAIDLAALGDAIRWEPSRHGQLFPHLCGTLTMQTILAIGPLNRAKDGTVTLPGSGSDSK